MRHSLSLLLALCLNQSVLAYQPLVTDDTGTQGAGGNQVELSITQNRNTDTAASTTTRTRTIPFVFTRGFTDALDVYAGASHARSKDAVGVIDNTDPNLVLGAKWRFFEQENGWSLGFKPELQASTPSARASWSSLLIASRDTSFGEFHANLFYARVNYKTGTDRRDQWRLSVAPVFQINDQFKAALDLGYTTNPTAGERSAMSYALLGAVYSPNDNLDIAFGWQKNLDEPGNKTSQATLGVTYRFK